MSAVRIYIKKICNKFFGLAKQLSAVLGNKSSALYIENLIASLVCGFLLSSVLTISFSQQKYTDINFINGGGGLLFLVLMTLISAAASVIMCFLFNTNRVTVAFLLCVSAVFGVSICTDNANIWLGCGVAVCALIVSIWASKQQDGLISEKMTSRRIVFICVCVMFAVFSVAMSLGTIYRYRVFGSSCFDFGIFTQMFDYMKTTGRPDTTVERNQLLSHFAVHFSPFFYLLLPGYMIFSTPEYLLCAQAILVAFSVFAVYGIACELGFSPKNTLLICAVYILYPSMSYGLFYDFHENKFLTICILFTFYFLLKRKWIGFYLCAIALCMIKEDAAIYLVAISLYMILGQKLFRHGILTLLGALVYFVFAINMTKLFGSGNSMEFGYRYSNFEINGEISFGTIIKTILLDIGYAIAEIFKQEKIEFILWMFLPVLFTPFMSGKISTLVLLMPMLIVNMLSSWQYQYNVDYQYTYGTGALIIICTMLALKDMSPRLRRTVLSASVIISVSLTVPRMVHRIGYYAENYYTQREMFDRAVDFVRTTLPKDAVISAGGNYIPFLYDYKNVYLEPYDGEHADEVEYFVVSQDNEHIADMQNKGFTLYAKEGFVRIYKRQ